MEEGVGMHTDARIGDTLSLWLPARTGKLIVRRSGSDVASVELDQTPPGPVEIQVGRARR
jgi:hypothetical protein